MKNRVPTIKKDCAGYMYLGPKCNTSFGEENLKEQSLTK
jgi:hypothetical protein